MRSSELVEIEKRRVADRPRARGSAKASPRPPKRNLAAEVAAEFRAVGAKIFREERS
jgi:hypothetical protein